MQRDTTASDESADEFWTDGATADGATGENGTVGDGGAGDDGTADDGTADERPPGSLGTRVCLALTDEEDVHPWKSPPLYEVLDPGVLEALDGQDNDEWRLEFRAGTHTVVVSGDGEVRVDGERFTDRDYREALAELDDGETGRRRFVR
ncbi:HalOD1 output domain-containing protein [Halorussus salinus]|uniref:HalOD1 output domain-containing protein n=1 Tax=Halorussus salinus TaxID=1364935 RepID=UPI001091D63C|nr:HalOD1 output domain-containing protein [Halorussus salinus]